MLYYDRSKDLAKAAGCEELKPPRLCPAGVIPMKWRTAYLEDGAHRMHYFGVDGGSYWRNVEFAYPSHGYPTWPE